MLPCTFTVRLTHGCGMPWPHPVPTLGPGFHWLRRIRYRVRHIRELMSVWEGWMRFNQPAGYQPPAWDEADVFNNVLPWTVASTAEGLSEQHLRYRVFCVVQELRRCQEELRFLPQDALNTLRHYSRQQQQLSAAVADLRCQAAVTPAQVAHCRGKEHMLRAWQARIATLQQQAQDAFQEAGWIEQSASPA